MTKGDSVQNAFRVNVNRFNYDTQKKYIVLSKRDIKKAIGNLISASKHCDKRCRKRYKNTAQSLIEALIRMNKLDDDLFQLQADERMKLNAMDVEKELKRDMMEQIAIMKKNGELVDGVDDAVFMNADYKLTDDERMMLKNAR